MPEAIGIKPSQVDVSWKAVLDDRAQAMLIALRAARDELGRWPTAAEWDRSGQRPSRRTFARHFGSWAEACRAAADHSPIRHETSKALAEVSRTSMIHYVVPSEGEEEER